MKIRRRPKRNKTPWELDCGQLFVDGRKKRVQLYFATQTEARDELRRRENLLRQHGRAALGVSEELRGRFSAAAERLAEAGASIEEAVEFFLRHRSVVREAVTVSELVRRGIAARSGENLRLGYLGALATSWHSFELGREEMAVGDVSRRDVEGWLESHVEWRRKTKRNYLGDLSTLFSWARKSGLAAMNPCEDVSITGRDDEEEISCMTPEQARRLLETVAASDADFLGYVTIGLFCGVRVVELEKMQRAAVDAEGVIVGAATAKTRSRRVVTLPACAAAWLERWPGAGTAEKCGPAVLPWSWERRWSRIRQAAGWSLPWPRNVIRHTFASMHFALHGDEGKLKREMGHYGSMDTLFRHYRSVAMLNGQRISREVAAEFFSLRPR